MDQLTPTLTLTTLLPLAMFAIVSSITPGPNNVMLTASGATFGYRRTLPHMLGISAGGALMLLLVGAGLGTAFSTWPLLYTLLQIAGGIYLLWLAWKISQAGGIQEGRTHGKPFSFWQAAAFQWVNPKAWVMAVGAITTYTPAQGYVTNVMVIAAVFALVNLPSVGVWVMFGSALRNLLQNPRWLMLFNVLMALLLVISLYPLLFVESVFP